MCKKIVLSILIIVCLGLFSACGDNLSAAERINEKTGLLIPQDAVQEYYYWNIDFQGSYSLYALFKFEETPEEFLEENSFEVCDTKVIYYALERAKQHIPEEYQANLKGDFLSNLEGSFFFLETNRFVVVDWND